MTTQEILTKTESLYPSAVSNTDKIGYMNDAQNELSPYFGIIAEDSTLKTVIDQDSYALPTGIKDISDIISLSIGNIAVPLDRYNYTQYTLNKSEDNPMVEYGYYQIVNSTGTKKLCIYPSPDVVNLPIVIRYRKRLTLLSASALTVEPDFDSNFHVMLAYYCCKMICSSGPSPDSYQANMFMQMYDEKKQELWKVSMENEEKAKKVRTDNRQWHKSRTYHAGY